MGMEERRIMVCPLTCPGKRCVEGKREDFPVIEGTKLQETCRWWVAVQGTTPQVKEVTNLYDCSIPWIVTAGVNQAKEACGTTASVDKMVNTFVKVLPPKVKMQLMNESKKPPMILNQNTKGENNENT